MKNPHTQPVIHKQYGFYIYASTYKGKLASTSSPPSSLLVILSICSVKLFFLPVTHFYGLSKDVGSDEVVKFKHWDL